MFHAPAFSRALSPCRVLIVLVAAAFAVCYSGARLKAEQAAPLHERIDQMIESAHIGPLAERCDDAEFLRRASLDLTGVIPTSDEVRAFLDDPAQDKRAKLVERLLESPRYALHMTDTLDVMLMERRPDKNVKGPEWRAWLHESLTANKPYNVLAAEILGADGVDPDKRAPAKFYLDRDAESNLLTRDVGRMFFGRDMQCAQCHDHPVIDDYLQQDYYGVYAFLSRSYVFTDAKKKVSMLAEKAEGDVDFKSVFTGEAGKTLPTLPGGEPVAEPTFEKGQEYEVKPAKDVRPIPKYSRREQLARLVEAGENEAFRRNIVNRLWAHMMGRGIVDPPDLHHSSNPPSHPALLAMLAEEFAAGDYDMKALLHELALTETYQRAFEMPADLEKQASAAVAELAKLQAEKQQLARAYDAANTAAGDALSAMLKGKEAAAGPSEEDRKKAADAVTAAKKAMTAASAEIAQAESQVAEQKQTAALLAAADSAAQKVVGRLSDDKSLAEAAAQFAKRAAEFKQQIAAAEKAVADKQAAAKSAAAMLAAAEKAVAELDSKTETAEKQLAALEQAVAKAESRRDAASAALAEFEPKLNATRMLAEFAAAAKSTAEARARLQSEGDKFDQAEREKLEAEASRFTVAEQAITDHFAERFAVATLKPLTPEQLAWSILQATGQLDAQRTAAAAEIDKQDAAKKAKEQKDAKGDNAKDEKPKDEPVKKDEQPKVAPEPAPREVRIEQAARAKLQGSVNAFVGLFGGAPGTPQQDFVATVDQALFFSNGSQVRGWLRPSGENLTGRSLKLAQPELVAEELYLSIFGRLPSKAESVEVAAYLASQPKARDVALQEIAWGLLTSAEFRFNH
ncbi:MAG: DUF1549 domain-containing protein [Pirellulaceae bacterium]